MRRNRHMRVVAFVPIGTEPVFVAARAMLYCEEERRAGIPVKELGRIHLVPAREKSVRLTSMG